MIRVFEGERHYPRQKLGTEANHAVRKGCCGEGHGNMYATSFYPDIQGAPLYPPTEPDGSRYISSLARASPGS